MDQYLAPNSPSHPHEGDISPSFVVEEFGNGVGVSFAPMVEPRKRSYEHDFMGRKSIRDDLCLLWSYASRYVGFTNVQTCERNESTPSIRELGDNF